MLIAKDLPKFLWAKAVSYATWLKNRLPSRVTPGTTPYELVRKAKPSLAQAREFGCAAYVHLLDAGKLELRAEEGVFVGVDAESKGYRIYWPEKWRVSVERNVTFAPTEVTVAQDVLNEGESNTTPNSNSNNNNNNDVTVTEADNAPTVQHIPVPPSSIPTPEPRVMRSRPAPGYYTRLQSGQTATVAIESLERALAAAKPEPTLQPAGIEWPRWG